ncbi:hypothetical protein SAMN05216486_1147 [bacterium JGI 053]|nr:hypothetical protein SAMN05216486_1147 [bacterium JGI 053]
MKGLPQSRQPLLGPTPRPACGAREGDAFTANLGGTPMHSTLLRTAVPALLVLCAGCAAGPNTGISPNNQTSNTVLISDDGTAMSVNGASAVANSIRTTLPVDSALARLRAAYEMASIPVTVFDPATGRVGNSHLLVRRALNREALSTFVDCGHSMTAVHADQDQLNLSIVSTIRPVAGGGSVVETLLTGSASDRTSGNATDMLPCSTRGVLETRLHRNAFELR